MSVHTVKAIAVIVLVLGSGAEVRAQAGSMFSDPKAANIGDAVTVIIQESASATNQTSTSTDKESDVQIESAIPGAGNVLDFVPLHSLESSSSSQFDGSGSTSRSASLNARVTVNVVGKKHNGDLLIEGVRTLKINGETEAIHVSGSVAPPFILANNTVLSSNISDLNIEYTGKGTITQGSRPGIFVRIVNWLL